jgi:hypothetical protein
MEERKPRFACRIFKYEEIIPSIAMQNGEADLSSRETFLAPAAHMSLDEMEGIFGH